MSFVPMGDAIGTAARRATDIAERVRSTSPEERIRRGVELYGWSPEAQCSWCGDTGQTPLSGQYCECPAGIKRSEDDVSARLMSEWERRWGMTNVPRRFRDYRLETSPVGPDVVAVVRQWIASDPLASGANLIITGSVGTGKTGLAVGALWDLHQAGVQPLWFVSASGLIDALRPNSGDDRMFEICQRAAVLVIDDLGTTRGTAWEQDRLFALCNARYEDQRPTIVTTNVTYKVLAESIGERIVSRLTESHAAVPVGGDDLRRTAMRRLRVAS